VIVRGKPDTRAIAGGALGLLGLGVGLSKLPVFIHGLVLSVLPSNVARAVVALTIAAGAAATCLGLVVFAVAADRPEEEPLPEEEPCHRQEGPTGETWFPPC
jgi:hypothetical protein